MDETLHAADLGIDIPHMEPNWPRIQAHKNQVVKRLRAQMRADIEQQPIDYYHAQAHAHSPQDIRLHTARGDKRLIARALVLATGSRPKALPDVPFDGGSIICSDQALDLAQVPTRLVIVGGGFIGCEMACVYTMAGTQVTLVEAQPQLLPQLDPWVGRALQRQLENLGITVMIDTQVTSVLKDDILPLVTLADQRTLPAEKVLVAIGRQPVCDHQTRRALGLTPEGQAIVVDPTLQTAVPNVYALGDAIGTTFLAHGATAEAEVVAANLTGRSRAMASYDWIPKVVYTLPDVVSVGKSLRQCREQGLPVCVGQASFQENGRAQAQGQTTGTVQMVVDAQQRLHSITMIGPGVSEMAALAGALLRSPHPFDRLCVPHPTYTETLVDAWEDACHQTPHVPDEEDIQNPSLSLS
jgi:dihydrolipoamide dehydrogenase